MRTNQEVYNRKTVDSFFDGVGACPTCGGKTKRLNGAKLRAYREGLGVSLNQAAHLAGCSANHLSNLELDRKIRAVDRGFVERLVAVLEEWSAVRGMLA